MTHQERRIRQVEVVLGHLADYARAGHRLRFERRHGPREDDNEIVFSITDWPAFIGVMEPGHPLTLDMGEASEASEASGAGAAERGPRSRR